MEPVISMLIVSDCPQSLAILSDACEKYGIKRVVSRTGLAGFEALRKVKFDLLVLDIDCAGASSLLDVKHGKYQSCQTPIIALNAAAGRFTPEQRGKIQYPLQKPLSADQIAQAFKNAYRTIAVEKRVSFRYVEELPALDAHFRENNARHPLPGTTILDISCTGFCMKTRRQLPKDTTVFINFKIPGENRIVHAVGNVAWSDMDGRAGVEFRFVPSEEFVILRAWLGRQNPWMPELTARPISLHGLSGPTADAR